MRQYEVNILSDRDCLPSWYLAERYEYSEMYSDTYEAIKPSLFGRIIELFF